MLTWLRSNLTLIGVIIIGILMLIALGSIRSCMDRGKEAAQAKQNAKSADAYAGAAKEAVATVVERANKDASVDAVVTAATLEIDNAENPVAARAAVIASLCSLRSYANRPECALHRSNP